MQTAGMLLWIALATAACSGKPDDGGAPSTGLGKPAVERPSRADCEQMFERMSGLIVAQQLEDPGALWDTVAARFKVSIPATTTREGFPAFLESEAGKAWGGELRKAVRADLDGHLDECTATATKAHITCVLAARDRAEVDACDRAAGATD
jgi:hypothetical protein